MTKSLNCKSIITINENVGPSCLRARDTGFFPITRELSRRPPTPLRVLVTGSRTWICPDLARRILDGLIGKLGRDLVVVHGGCRGVDASFAMACRELGIPDEPHPADWSRGTRAGPERNQRMVDAGAAFAIAVHRDLAGRRGTRDCVGRCLDAGIPVYLVDPIERARRLTELP